MQRFLFCFRHTDSLHESIDSVDGRKVSIPRLLSYRDPYRSVACVSSTPRVGREMR